MIEFSSIFRPALAILPHQMARLSVLKAKTFLRCIFRFNSFHLFDITLRGGRLPARSSFGFFLNFISPFRKLVFSASEGLFERPLPTRPIFLALPRRIITSSSSIIVVGWFSLFHNLHRKDSCRQVRNAPIMSKRGFFSQSNCKYFALYSLTYFKKIWSLCHFIAPSAVTPGRCWYGFRHVSPPTL